MNWSILGIEATKDKKAITKAYRSKLIHTNPEDKPEEFKALRAAYEEAMALADQTDAEEAEEEKTPLARWLDKLDALYNNFQDRLTVDCWRELLSDEICQGLDTRPEAEDAMLRFLMEKYHLTHKVWVYLDQEFSFRDRKDDLYEKYPKDFVDYVVINGIRYEDNLPFDMFEPGENAAECELIMKLFNQADSAPIGECGVQIAQLESLSEHHPYTDALSIRYRISQGENEAIENLRTLCEKYPTDSYLLLALAEECHFLKQWPEAEAAADQCLKLLPSNYAARWYMAQAQAGQGNYEEAVDHLNEMMRLCAGNDNHIVTLNQVRKEWNEKLIEQYRKMLEEKPEDPKTRLDLAWCYLQNDRYEEARECASHIPENQPDLFDYNNLMCVLYNQQKKYEEALRCNGVLLSVLEKMQSGSLEADDRKLKRFPEMLSKRGLMLILLDRPGEADEVFARALAMKPDDAELLGQTVRAKIIRNDYQEALKYAEKYEEILPQELLPHVYLAMIHKMLGNDRAAFEECNIAIDLFPSDFRAYQIKLIILIRNEVYDQAHELIDHVKENGAGDFIVVRWCEVWLAHEEKKEAGKEAADPEGELALYQKLAEEIEKEGNDDIWIPEFYYQLAERTAEANDGKKYFNRQILIDILDKGLKNYPEDHNCLDYKAWLLKKEKRYEEARVIYEKLLKRPHRGVRIERELASIYYAELEKRADKAAEMFERVIEKDDNSVDRYYAGMSYFTMGNTEKACEHFLKEEELDPDDVDGYNRLSYVYEAMGRFEEALQQADRAIEIVKSWNDGKSHNWQFEHKAQIYRRTGKPEEAVKVYREAMALYGKKFEGHKLIFYTYLQYGMYEKAEEILKEWKKFSPNVVGNNYDLPRLAAIVELELVRKQFVRAKISFTNYSAAMLVDDRERLAFIVDSGFGGSAKTYLKHHEMKIKTIDPEDGDYPGYLAGYIDALWLNGKEEEARKYAQIALDKLEEILKRFYRNRTMHLTKKIPLLYLLGRTEELEACLKEIQEKPMCDGCSYHACKDADIYMVRGLIYQGKKEEALKLITEFQKKWPDETDFIFYENVLKKKNDQKK